MVWPRCHVATGTGIEGCERESSRNASDVGRNKGEGTRCGWVKCRQMRIGAKGERKDERNEKGEGERGNRSADDDESGSEDFTAEGLVYLLGGGGIPLSACAAMAALADWPPFPPLTPELEPEPEPGPKGLETPSIGLI